MVNKLSCLYKGHEGIKFFLFFILETRSDPDVPWQRGEVFKLCPHARECCTATKLTSASIKRPHRKRGQKKQKGLRVLIGVAGF